MSPQRSAAQRQTRDAAWPRAAQPGRRRPSGCPAAIWTAGTTAARHHRYRDLVTAALPPGHRQPLFVGGLVDRDAPAIESGRDGGRGLAAANGGGGVAGSAVDDVHAVAAERNGVGDDIRGVDGVGRLIDGQAQRGAELRAAGIADLQHCWRLAAPGGAGGVAGGGVEHRDQVRAAAGKGGHVEGAGRRVDRDAIGVPAGYLQCGGRRTARPIPLVCGRG